MVFQIFPPAVVADPIETTAQEAAFGIHAGDWETSVMMHLSPDRVRMDKLDKAFPLFSEQHLALEFRGATVAWLTRDFQKTGTWGDATIATAERGKARADAVLAALRPIFEEIVTFEFQA